jgi:hypothetical protein
MRRRSASASNAVSLQRRQPSPYARRQQDQEKTTLAMPAGLSGSGWQNPAQSAQPAANGWPIRANGGATENVPSARADAASKISQTDNLSLISHDGQNFVHRTANMGNL